MISSIPHPTFICIGAHKAGTTWLAAMLSKQKEVWIPPVKEIHYFDRDARYPSPGMLAQRRLRMLNPEWRSYSWRFLKANASSLKDLNSPRFKWVLRYVFGNYSDQWYRDLFKSGNSVISGEATPAYAILENEDVARMHAVVPDTKLIFMLRNPIDRMWSSIRYQLTREQNGDLGSKNDKLGSVDNLTLEKFRRMIQSPGYKQRSDYLSTIDKFRKHYSSDQLLIGFYDAVSDNPVQLLQDICDYVGVTKEVNVSKVEKRVNQSLAMKMPDELRGILEEEYRGQIEILAERYGSYACKWLAELNGEKFTDLDALKPTVEAS